MKMEQRINKLKFTLLGTAFMLLNLTNGKAQITGTCNENLTWDYKT